MEIQFSGKTTFFVKGKDAQVVFNPEEGTDVKKCDAGLCTTYPGLNVPQSPVEGLKHYIGLPGEYEISGVLIKGVLADKEVIIYKITVDGLACGFFPPLQSQPSAEMLDQMGDLDVAIINISSDFDAKEVKKLLDNVDPRIGIIGGDESLFGKLQTEIPVKTAEKNPLEISKSTFSDEKSEYFILPV